MPPDVYHVRRPTIPRSPGFFMPKNKVISALPYGYNGQHLPMLPKAPQERRCQRAGAVFPPFAPVPPDCPDMPADRASRRRWYRKHPLPGTLSFHHILPVFLWKMYQIPQWANCPFRHIKSRWWWKTALPISIYKPLLSYQTPPNVTNEKSQKNRLFLTKYSLWKPHSKWNSWNPFTRFPAILFSYEINFHPVQSVR